MRKWKKITVQRVFKYYFLAFFICILSACSSAPQQNSQKDEYQREIDYYSQIIQINPKNVEAYKKRADNYFYLECYHEALEDLTIVIELSPQSDKLLNMRTHIYFLLGQNQDALKDANRAIEINPEDAINHFNRGMLYYYMKYYKEALKDINQAIMINPTDLDFFDGRGLIYEKLSKNTKDESLSEMYRQKSEDDFAAAEAMKSSE